MQTTTQTPSHAHSSTTSNGGSTHSHRMLRHPVLRYHYAQLCNYINDPDSAPYPATDLRDLRIAIMAALYHLDQVAAQTADMVALLAPILKPPRM